MGPSSAAPGVGEDAELPGGEDVRPRAAPQFLLLLFLCFSSLCSSGLVAAQKGEEENPGRRLRKVWRRLWDL
jgi:hypothetical protein